jgi:hypothetical protein
MTLPFPGGCPCTAAMGFDFAGVVVSAHVHLPLFDKNEYRLMTLRAMPSMRADSVAAA